MAGLPLLANLSRLGCKARPAHCRLIVLAHASNVASKRLSRRAPRRSKVLGYNNVHKRRYLDRRRIPARRGRAAIDFGYALAQPRPRPMDRQPAIRNSSKLVDAFRRKRCNVQRHIVAKRLESQSEAAELETFTV